MVKKLTKDKRGDFLKFLGTAGARFVMINQLRSSGGLWVSCRGTNVLVDPGPGSLVRCAASKPRLDPTKLDAVILTHRHLDHANDANVMIEAMTEGGFKKRGVLFCPADALEEDAVILKYARQSLEKIEVIQPNRSYEVNKFSFETSMRHMHPVETYGLKFRLGQSSVALLSDTRYFRELRDFYAADILVISVVFLEPRPGVEHLSLADAKALIEELRPKKAILSHFGMSMIKAKPHLLAEDLSRELGIEVIAAYDGMTLDFP